MKSKKLLIVLVAALASLGVASASLAGLNAVHPGPYTDAYGGHPVWYQDTFGRGLELCLNQSLCLPPVLPDPTLAMDFPGNWPDELFWFTGDAEIIQGGVDLTYVSALEAAFGGAGGVVNGEQISFARIRVFADVPSTGTYTLTHPYGIEVFEVDTVDAGREIQFTRDIGIAAPGDFTGALKGDIGPFLVRVDDNGNPSLITAVDGVFIGNPNVTQRVTGSPFGTNFVRIEGPGGIDFTTDQFFISGLVYSGALASPLVVDRTTYSRAAGQTQVQLDVFAKSAPTAAVSFTPPNTTMGGDAFGRFFGQAIVPDTDLPATVDVTAASPPNSPVTVVGNLVTDVVTITKAEYSGGTLVIEAVSSDVAAQLPILTASVGNPAELTPVAPGPTQILTVSGLTIPPASVTVSSEAGGTDTEEVVVRPVALP